MNAIPLINNAPKFRPDVNVNVNHIGGQSFNPVSSQMGNVMRQNPYGNETQLRQEVNTSIVALKREAFSLENLIAQAAQTLQDVNKRLSELEGKQGDYVKKSDVVDSITSGNMNPVTSNAVANSNAMPVNSVTSGNMHSVTSNAVAEKVSEIKSSLEWKILSGNDIKNIPNNYTEIGISIYFTYGTDQILASKVFARDMLETESTQRVFIDGYYYSAGDYGLINVTNTSGVITLRQVIYNGSDYKSSANLRIRYR